MVDRIKKLEDKLLELGDIRSEERVDLLNELVMEIGWDDPRRSATLANEAFALAKELSYQRGIAYGTLHQAIQYYFLTHFEEALAKGHEAHALFREIGDRDGEGEAIQGWAFVSWGLGDYEKALHHMHESLKIFREPGNRERESWALTSLGGVYATGFVVQDLERHAERVRRYVGCGQGR